MRRVMIILFINMLTSSKLMTNMREERIVGIETRYNSQVNNTNEQRRQVEEFV
jgi:hypothetical protein